MLLRQESWLGQQHGDGNAEVYARHMKPLCDVIPASERSRFGPIRARLMTSKDLIDMEAPNNLALFVSPTHTPDYLFCD